MTDEQNTDTRKLEAGCVEADDQPPEPPNSSSIKEDKISPPHGRRIKIGSSENPLFIRDPDLGSWTRWLVISTVALVVVSSLQWYELGKAGTQAERQLHVMEAGQRPWIKIDVIPGNLTFIPQSNEASFQYSFQIQNVGNSVAVGVRVAAKIIAPPFDEKVFDGVSNAQEAFCSASIENKATEKEDKNHMGINLFPNESYPENDFLGGGYVGSANLSDVEMIAAEPLSPKVSPGVSPPKLPERVHDPLLKGMFAPYLIGCVTYQLGLSLGRHQTGFIYSIHRIDPARPNVPMFVKMGDNLSPPNIIFEKWFFGEGKID